MRKKGECACVLWPVICVDSEWIWLPSNDRYYLEPASPLKSLTNTSHATQANQNQSPAQSEQSGSLNSKSSWSSSSSNLWPLPSVYSSKSNGNGVNALSKSSSSELAFGDQFSSNGGKCIHNSNGTAIDSDAKSNGTNFALSHATKHNGNSLSSLSRPTVNNDSNVITKNNFNLLQSAAILEKANHQSDFVADFGSADIFNAANALQITANGGRSISGIHKLMNGSFTSSDFDNTSSGSNASTSNGNGSINGDANANFADFEHNPIYNAAGKCWLGISPAWNATYVVAKLFLQVFHFPPIWNRNRASRRQRRIHRLIRRRQLIATRLSKIWMSSWGIRKTKRTQILISQMGRTTMPSDSGWAEKSHQRLTIHFKLHKCIRQTVSLLISSLSCSRARHRTRSERKYPQLEGKMPLIPWQTDSALISSTSNIQMRSWVHQLQTTATTISRRKTPLRFVELQCNPTRPFPNFNWHYSISFQAPVLNSATNPFL